MKVAVKYFVFFLAAVFLNSCTDVIQVKLDQGSKLYVIDAFVNDLRVPQIIRVTTNDSYFSNREAPPVSNASVVLSDLTVNKQYTFDYTSNGNYMFDLKTTDTISRRDHQYRLDVTIDGVTYTSMTTQKRTAVLDSISQIAGGRGGLGPPSTDKSIFSCLLYARDKADNNPDYYWVKTFRNDTLFTGSEDINVSIDGTGGVVTNAPADTIPFTPPAIFLSFKTYKKNDVCKVEIHSISKETYYFFMQAINQLNNGGLFATTPQNVPTNITTPAGAKTKAIGFFNMAGVVSKSKTIQ